MPRIHFCEGQSYIESTRALIYRIQDESKNIQTFSALEFIAAITQHIPERKVIKKILDHLGLLKKGEPKRNKAPPAPVTKCAGTIVEPYDDGWPEYEELFVNMQTL